MTEITKKDAKAAKDAVSLLLDVLPQSETAIHNIAYTCGLICRDVGIPADQATDVVLSWSERLRSLPNFKDLYPLYRKPSFYKYQVRYAVQSAYKRPQDKPSSSRFKSLTGKKAPAASFWDTVAPEKQEKKDKGGKVAKEKAKAKAVVPKLTDKAAAVAAEKKRVRAEGEDLIKIFEFALGQEETGKSFFESSVQRMGWGAALSAFNDLIEEEEHHIVFIKKILEDLRKGKGDASKLKLGRKKKPGGENFFSSRAKAEFLEKLLQESMIPDVTVFSIAWLIEKDLSEYYEKMAEHTEGKARDALLMLAEWERGHEKFFREFRDKLTDVYSRMPWGG